MWKDQGSYYMLLGTRTRGSLGEALLYRSEDKKAWRFLKTITATEPFGYMWECPDYFKVEGRPVFAFSPQGIEAEEYRFENIYQSGYLADVRLPDIGQIRDIYKKFREWDLGFDFYAPQTFETPAGRRILIGWAGVPDAEYSSNPTNEGWQHSLTVPRELRYHNGKIYQLPIRELGQLRKKEILPEKESYVLDNGCGELIFDGIAASSSAAICVQIGTGCSLSYEKGLVTLQFTDDSGAGRGKRVARCEAVHKIQILMDVSILEIYINDGEIVMTSRIFFPEKDATVRFLGQAEMIQAWQL